MKPEEYKTQEHRQQRIQEIIEKLEEIGTKDICVANELITECNVLVNYEMNCIIHYLFEELPEINERVQYLCFIKEALAEMENILKSIQVQN